MSGNTVRRRFVKEFRDLRGHSPRVAGLIVLSYIGQLFAAIGVGYWLLQYPLTPLTGTALAFLMLFIATRFRGFNNIVHECSHFTFSQRREDNVFYGSICASMVLSSFREYREEHMTHHAHLGDYEHDMDLQGIRDLRLEDPLTPRTVLRHVTNAAFALHLPHYFNPNLSARDGRGFAVLKLGLVALAAAFLVFDPMAALLLLWLPFIWLYTAVNYLTDCVDHGGLIESGDELDASRNFIVARQLRALLFPRNDCYHLVHHLFPQIPSNHLEACHERLLSDPEYRARAEAPGFGAVLEGLAARTLGEAAPSRA